jgi:hypothetical protein
LSSDVVVKSGRDLMGAIIELEHAVPVIVVT